MKYRLIIAVLVALLAVVSVQAITDDSSADASDNKFLVDFGNGYTMWFELKSGETVADSIKNSLSATPLVFSDDLTMIDNMSKVTIGGASTGGSITEPGMTGNTSVCEWHFFKLNNGEWIECAGSDAADGSPLAVAYYPEGIIPVETPEYNSSWTTIQGDSWNSANQTTTIESEQTGEVWKYVPAYGGEDPNGLYGGALVAREYAILKFGNAGKTSGLSATTAFNYKTGEKIWSFESLNKTMDTTSALVVGQYVYIGSNNGHLYKFNWKEGPGEGNVNVTTIGGAKWDDEKAVVPSKTIDIEWQVSYGCTFTSLVCDSGAIYVKAYNGMTYCFDLDLNLLWSYQMEGHNYYNTPTVFDGYVFAGCYDGTLYVMDQKTGELITKTPIYQSTDSRGLKWGSAATPQVFKNDDSTYTVIVTYSDGKGMSSEVSSMMILTFDGSELTAIKDFRRELNSTSAFVTRYETEDFKGVIAQFRGGLYKIDLTGDYELITDIVSGSNSTHNAPVLVNNSTIYVTTNSSLSPMRTIEYDLATGEYGVNNGIADYSMVNPVVINGYALICDDSGIYVFYSTYPEYVPPVPVPSDEGAWKPILYILGALVAILVILWLVLRFVFKWEHPFSDLKMHIMHFFFGTEYTHNTRSKRKVRAVFAFGVVITLIISLVSLCVGPETTMGLGDAFNNMISAISKGGQNLTYEEMLIYNQRLPRVLAAIGVGVGLSVAGAMYQAVIKNPLVEPYIMGVSSGAGTFAVAVLTFNFTFFGLFAANSIYLTAFSAIFGGLLAFGLTMLLALKTGGKSINFVLAGIVIGLVFSAVQSLLMINAGTKVASALSWLYGSFSTMTWDKVWLVLIPAIFLSMVPLIWAKEFNLVLLGEDQAKQMGLNAKRFDAIMLIVASVLTSFCVAFCGVIGFVGLVIPHLSRMILGGDHRLMLPATMAFGGFLMVAADLLARVLLSGYELPVGAITTVIGVPVFAYLLIKRGRSYDV
jgi:iron complex transport system permease protein